ncbi:MAG: hydroxymyristoyl-ACP dehydratase [Bacteroidales bacterium]|nr:hydroxymyristoyl-ACP dehydratase [Bacteroidales bacterium]
MASFEEVTIPQKPPMVMVDKLIRADGGIVETTLMVTEENVFCDNGIFTEAGLIENMAQTAAAGVGSKTGLSGKEPPIGFIGGIRNLKILRYPASGDELQTRITLEHEVFGASVVYGEVFHNQELIASCQLKIFLQE